MVPIPAHPFPDILPPVLLKEPGVVKGGLAPFPHVIQLAVRKEAHAVAQLHHLPGRGIVAETDGVDAHLLHQLQLPFGRLRIESRPQGAQVVVQAYAMQLNAPAVQEKAAFAVKGGLPETDGRLIAAPGKGRFKGIDIRIVNIPQPDTRDFALRFCFPLWGHRGRKDDHRFTQSVLQGKNRFVSGLRPRAPA